MAENTMKIKVSENGPYIVTGSVHVDEKIITPEGNSYRWVDGREIEQKGEKFAMCRCGHSKHAPYCDGTHAKIGFDGTETASKAAYKDRVGYFDGPVIDLADDDRCAFARFCHAHEGDVWTLAMSAESDEEVAIATQTASNCPAGRLTAKPHGGDFIEPELEPGITVVQDPEKGVSSGLYVHGGITLEGADGETYELRNRYML
ncbi:MAG: CDGSH iron-sulfur domain-containing protein, partial [Arcanobacterium sp.]|nr:CDGSH iron-sulfur domain-containing protein [Arcanobacterium sp.]